MLYFMPGVESPIVTEKTVKFKCAALCISIIM